MAINRGLADRPFDDKDLPTTLKLAHGGQMAIRIRVNKWSNRLQATMLVLAMAGLTVLIGWTLLGRIGVLLAIGLVVFNIVIGPGISGRAVLRAYRAQPITVYEAPELMKLFSELVERANVPYQVELYYVPSRTPNAFAVGVGLDSAIAVTDGLLRILNNRELAGVLAHELAHVRNQDTTVMGIADAMGRIATGISRFGMVILLLGFPTLLMGIESTQVLLAGLLMFITPMVVFVLQMALSRSREFNADLGASELTNDPMGLASALAKLENIQQGSWWGRILNPNRYQVEPSWLRSHPATADRIIKLNEIARMIQSAAPTTRVEPKAVPVAFHQAVLRKPRYHLGSGVWY